MIRTGTNGEAQEREAASDLVPAPDAPAPAVPPLALLQVARLTKALRLADASIEKGDLKAVAPLTRLVAALDRYHGLGAAKAHWRPVPAASLPNATVQARSEGQPRPRSVLALKRIAHSFGPVVRARSSSIDATLRAQLPGMAAFLGADCVAPGSIGSQCLLPHDRASDKARRALREALKHYGSNAN